MKKILAAVSLALAVALAAPSPALCVPTDFRVMGLLYSNFVGLISADNLEGYEIIVRIKNGGAVLAEIDQVIPDNISGDVNVWPFFFTDWRETAEYIGLQPGYTIEIEFREGATYPAPGDIFKHKMSSMGFTKLNVKTDVIAGYFKPKPAGADFNGMIMGLKLDSGPTGGGGTIPDVQPDGTFRMQMGGGDDLIRNSFAALEYEVGKFIIAYNTWVPGLIAVKDTSYALMTGDPVEHYRSFLRDRFGRRKGFAVNESLEIIGVGLLQFHEGRKRVPIRRGDKIHLADRHGKDDWLRIPRNFEVKRVMENVTITGPAPAVVATTGFVFKAPPGTYVCLGFSGPGGSGGGCGPMSPTGRMFWPYTSPGLDAVQPVGYMLMQTADGDFIVDHVGIQDVASWFIAEYLYDLAYTPFP